MTATEKAELVDRLQRGRARARARLPQRLAELEQTMDDMGAEFRALPEGCRRRGEIIRALRGLGQERGRLQSKMTATGK